MNTKRTRLAAGLLFTLALWPLGASGTDTPQLVRHDGSYPVWPLEKDVIVLKVVQNGFTRIQRFR
jgi:hypothetical protein